MRCYRNTILNSLIKNKTNNTMDTEAKEIITPSYMAKLIQVQAGKIQNTCLKIRKELFYDSQRGFNHNIGGVRTGSSVKNAEALVDNLTGGLVRFKFRSHRLLWFSINGVEKRYLIDSANKYDYTLKDNEDSNPYLNIEKELRKAASDLIMIDKAYNEILRSA